MRAKPETIANLSIREYSFSKKQIKGVVEASQFKWNFTWSFNKKFELYFFERFSRSKNPILCLLFEYLFPGFPNPIKYISFMMYF